MNQRLRALLTLMAALLSLNAAAHYYNNVRVNDTPIRGLAQDESKQIWLGTGSGLYCYDGYRCVARYATVEALRATVYCMQASGYNLYIGTSDGFYVYDTRNGQCKEPKQFKKEVRALAFKDNSVLLGLPDGLWEYDIKTANTKLVDGSLSNIYSLAHVNGTTYAGTLKGLFGHHNGKTQEIILRKGEHPFINALLADESCLWVGAGDMLYQYNMESGQVKETPEMNGVSVKAMSVTDNHTLYIATDNGFYTYTNGHFALDKHNSQNPHSLADNVVWSTYIDRSGNIILGTDGGLSIINAVSYYTYKPISTLTGMADGNKFSTLLVDSKGRKWTGGSNGLILKDGQTTRWFHQVNKNNLITHNRIRCIYEDTSGNIWIATDNGINLYDEDCSCMRNIVITDEKEEYTTRWAYDIIDDGQGNLWVAAFSGGIFIVNKEKLKKTRGFIVADKHIDQKSGGLSHLWVRQMKQDSKGNVWVRTGKGLDCINISSRKVTRVLNSAVGYIEADKDGNIWVANEKELLCYKGVSEYQSYSYGVKQSDVDAVSVCDVNGQIWVITATECIVIGNNNNRRLRIPVIDAYGAYYAKEDKCLFIGGQDGLVSIFPSAIGDGSKRNRLLLSEFRVNGEQYQIKGDDIELAHNENTIELSLTDLPYMGDVSVSYAYKLEGVDESWHLLPSLSEPLVYNALTPGNYTLRIKTIDSSQGDEDEVFSTNIRILPPWYLSIWAKIFYILLAQGLILWAIRFYIIRKKLQREKREKMRIIEQSKARMDFYNNMSANLSQTLHQVMAPLAEMIAKKDDSETRTALSAVRTQTTRMNMLIRKAFDVGNIKQHDESLTLTKINMIDFCRETIEGMKPVLEKKNVSIAFDADCKAVYMYADVLRFDSALTILIQNILDNANYHSELSMKLQTDQLQKKIRLTLSGSSVNPLDKVPSNMFQQMITNDLYLVKDSVAELGGKFRIEPTETQGTTFSMTFDALEIVSESANTVLAQAIETEPEEIISEKDEKLMREITMAIEENLIDSDFNVTRLQETVGIGQKLLYRKIKQIAGVTPVEYIRNIRMEKAARQLREGKFSISEVMYMVGFTKSGYFSKCFQETFGMTPSAYIKNTNNL